MSSGGWEHKTKIQEGDYVRINKYGSPFHMRYCQVLRSHLNFFDQVLYDVETIDVVDDVGAYDRINNLKTYELTPAPLNAMQVLAFQARPRPPGKGKSGHDRSNGTGRLHV